jgi:hypothetical protein
MTGIPVIGRIELMMDRLGTESAGNICAGGNGLVIFLSRWGKAGRGVAA